MKLHFESDLPDQIQAIEAVCDLLGGQGLGRSVFTVTAQALGGEGPQQSFAGKQPLDFTVAVETGTGQT